MSPGAHTAPAGQTLPGQPLDVAGVRALGPRRGTGRVWGGKGRLDGLMHGHVSALAGVPQQEEPEQDLSSPFPRA